ncbi:hypothetical protein LZZ85_26120 [Terrimonas sp. NA20]|uniref:Adhesin domain-containing protein n=1 Tax=Terrimonas ginsenosidimutans TaxID=2908004 RepID=A0ABS9KZJ1_9BACT|nr:hypothetical protein [Terrimonas ginsenosidimutans]MCG2617804.1 hypothetical protein [Terrimonas ginsenosidimutans]
MQKKKNHVAFSAILLLLSIITFAQKNEKMEFEKERSISKTYPASGNSLSLDNTFGHIKLIIWDKTEVKVDVQIKAGSSDREMAEKTFEAIEVQEGLANGKISFKTKVNNRNEKGCKNCKTNMHIDYEVHLPVNMKLTINNSFGNVSIPDYKGEISINNKFGAVTAGALAEVKTLHIEFGSAEIKSLTDVSAVFKFSKVQIGNLGGTSKVSMEFCDSSRISMSGDLAGLTLNESYSTINLRPAVNLGASYTVNTSFGTFIDRSNAGVVRTDTPDRYGPDSERRYEGKTGTGAVKINVRSSFGKIILGEATEGDLKKGSRSFSRNAGRVI